MDAKQQWLVERIASQIVGGSFSELDVLALLILLRDNAPKESPVREFGDFVAHRERDRGFFLKIMRQLKLRMFADISEEMKSAPRLPIFTVPEIHQSLNETLSIYGLRIDAETANRISVCVISLLQHVKLAVDPSIAVQGLTVGISTRTVGLFVVGTAPPGHVFPTGLDFQFPVLLSANHGYKYSPPLPSMANARVPVAFSGVVEASCVNDVLIIEQKARAA